MFRGDVSQFAVSVNIDLPEYRKIRTRLSKLDSLVMAFNVKIADMNTHAAELEAKVTTLEEQAKTADRVIERKDQAIADINTAFNQYQAASKKMRLSKKPFLDTSFKLLIFGGLGYIAGTLTNGR